MVPEHRELLEKVYEMSEGNEHVSVPEGNVRGALGQEPEDNRKFVDWLVGQGFLKRGPKGDLQLTSVGIKKIESETDDSII
jgi:hypothetical protein